MAPMSKEAHGGPAAGEPRLHLVTHPVEGAAAFARRLVEARLAACVNLLPATSVYRWEGEVQEDAEVLLVAKGRAGSLPALLAFLEEHHPYDVPECVSLAPDGVAPSYLAWWLGSTEEPDA